jgi:hypothetical protein
MAPDSSSPSAVRESDGGLITRKLIQDIIAAAKEMSAAPGTFWTALRPCWWIRA